MKPRYKSKTYAWSAVIIAFALAVFALPELQVVVETLPAESQGTVLLVIGVITAILRELTKEPVGPPSPPPEE